MPEQENDSLDNSEMDDADQGFDETEAPVRAAHHRGPWYKHPAMAFLAGGLLVAGAFTVYQLSRKPATLSTPVPQPTATAAIIQVAPDDEIIFHSKPDQAEQAMYVSAKGTNMRQDPGITAPILTTLAKNTEVTDLGIRKVSDDKISWANIRLADGRTGWIADKLLSQTPLEPDPTPTPSAPPSLPTQVPAQPTAAPGQASGPASDTADAARIRNRALQWKFAWEGRQLATAEMIMHNDFSGEGMNKRAWLNKRKAEAARTKSRSIIWNDVQVSVQGNQAEVQAIQHYHDVFHSGKTYDSSVRIILSFIRWTDGNWYITRLRFRPT